MPTTETTLLSTDDEVRRVYAAHGAELYALAVRSLGDAGLAEEAVQETFTRAWRAGDRYDPAVASMRTWLYAIARNVIIDLARARAVRPQASGRAVPDQPDPTTDLADRLADLGLLTTALASLSDDQRYVVVEICCRGRTSVDLAAELGAPEGTVRSRLHHGLRKLRDTLRDTEVDHG